MLCCSFIALGSTSVRAADAMQVIDQNGKPVFIVDPANAPSDLMNDDVSASNEADMVEEDILLDGSAAMPPAPVSESVPLEVSENDVPDIDIPGVNLSEESKRNLAQIMANQEQEKASEKVHVDVPVMSDYDAPEPDVPSTNSARPGEPVPIFAEEATEPAQEAMPFEEAVPSVEETVDAADIQVEPPAQEAPLVSDAPVAPTEPIVEPSVDMPIDDDIAGDLLEGTANEEMLPTPEEEAVLVKEVDAVPPPEEVQFEPPSSIVQEISNNDRPIKKTKNIMPSDGLFYDSEAQIPRSEMSKKGVVRSVLPSIEPASKLDIVVRSNKAGSRKAHLVSAERALKLGRYQSALEIYNNLYQKNPRDINVLMGRAIALQHLQRDEAAIQAYQDLLVESPGYTEASVNMYGLVAKRYPSVALRNLVSIHERYPQDVGVLAQMSVIEAHLGRYDSALHYVGIAAGYEPNNASHVYNMAVISDRAGDQKQAMKYYERALEIDAVYGGSRSVPREEIFARLGQLR